LATKITKDTKTIVTVDISGRSTGRRRRLAQDAGDEDKWRLSLRGLFSSPASRAARPASQAAVEWPFVRFVSFVADSSIAAA
jgi:hypothetical protein